MMLPILCFFMMMNTINTLHSRLTET
ncbi:hypothetical protein FF1_025534 [Malus domestica]